MQKLALLITRLECWRADNCFGLFIGPTGPHEWSPRRVPRTNGLRCKIADAYQITCHVFYENAVPLDNVGLHILVNSRARARSVYQAMGKVIVQISVSIAQDFDVDDEVHFELTGNHLPGKYESMVQIS